jgi:Holliday junction resolvase RusA-like endonuclease
MSHKLEITIPMEPQPKLRARVVSDGRGGVRSFTPDKTTNAEVEVLVNVLDWMSNNGQVFFEKRVPVKITVNFFRSRPKGLAKKHTKPATLPDIDNYYKMVADALEDEVYFNDGQVTTVLMKKRYGDPPRIELTVEEDFDE